MSVPPVRVEWRRPPDTEPHHIEVNAERAYRRLSEWQPGDVRLAGTVRASRWIGRTGQVTIPNASREGPPTRVCIGRVVEIVSVSLWPSQGYVIQGVLEWQHPDWVTPRRLRTNISYFIDLSG